jgi:hypothetical protein
MRWFGEMVQAGMPHDCHLAYGIKINISEPKKDKID